MLRYCCHANCRRFKHPSDFDESEEPRATCRKHKKEPPEAKKESQGHGARVHVATARDAGGEGLMEGTPIMEGTYIMGNETEEPPAKQQCLSPRGGARVHAPARSPGDSTLRPTPATAPRSELDEVSEAGIDHVVDTTCAARDDSPDRDLYTPDEVDKIFAEETEARMAAEAEHAEAATAPERYAHEDIQNDWGFLEGHDLGMHPEKDPFTLDEDLEMTWA